MTMVFNWLMLFTSFNWSIFNFALSSYFSCRNFVNFRLYHSIYVEYPPILDPQFEALAAGMYSMVMYVAISIFSFTAYQGSHCILFIC